MKVSVFLKRDISPFLYGAFMSRTMFLEKNKKKMLFCYTRYKTCTIVPTRIFDTQKYNEQFINELNYLSGLNLWVIHKSTSSIFEARLYLENDLDISGSAFYNFLREKLFNCKWVFSEGLTDDKRDFIRGFIELRGSVDTTAKYISEDYYFNTPLEFKKVAILTDYMGIPIKYANYNMRDLQYQHVMGIKKRKPQVRINSYFYAKTIGFLNKYKATVFEKAFKPLGWFDKHSIRFFNLNMPESRNVDVTFIKYLNFFSDNVYKKELNQATVNLLRKLLKFPTISEADEAGRNRTIVTVFDMIAPDKCAICGTEKTSLKKDGRQAFEIHHVISRCNGSVYDNIANLVKVCPNCHRALKRNGSPKEEQIKSIIKILNEHSEIFDFCSLHLNKDNINELAEEIQHMLG